MKVSTCLAALPLFALIGCTTPKEIVLTNPIGPTPTRTAAARPEGMLQVYSAREKFPINLNGAVFYWNNDFGKNDFLYESAHTGYTIYSREGAVVQHVRNARDVYDENPAVITLTPGSYTIEAEAKDYNDVTSMAVIPVVVQPGQVTRVHLDGEWKPSTHYRPSDVVWLPNGHIAGWRAASANQQASAAQNR